MSHSLALPRVEVSRAMVVDVAAIVATAAFVAGSTLASGPGFPLDDGWIHQTYARNLAATGRWEYVPGVVSAGSTAPLWTLLLALGYVLRLPYLWWTYALGGLCLLALARAAMHLWRGLWPERGSAAWVAGLTVALSWPLVWAAGSGMETLLFAALAVGVLGQVASGKWQVASKGDKGDGTRDTWPLMGLGFVTSLVILARPDGLIVLVLVAAALLVERLKPLLRTGRPKPLLRTMALSGLGAAVPLLPYFAFNLWSSGSAWPNTFYAKQQEYQVLLAEPLPWRFLRLLYFSLGGPEQGWRGMSGAHWLLLPGLVVAAVAAVGRDVKARTFQATMPLAWAAGHVLLFAWRLPVTYQHGRYLMAVLPVWIVYGLAGWWTVLRPRTKDRGLREGIGLWSLVIRLFRRTAVATFFAMLLLFLALGAQAYAADVAFIEGEMVETARWLRENTPAGALIAAHDIGAIGYFAGRPLLDLAGLVSPDLIPFLTDEAALAAYIQQNGGDYVVTAPGWSYDELLTALEAEEVYETNYEWTEEQGLNNVAVFRVGGDVGDANDND